MDIHDLKTLQKRLEQDEEVFELKEKLDKVALVSVDRVAPNSEDELNRILELAKYQGLFREEANVPQTRGLLSDLLGRLVPLKIAGPAFAAVAIVAFWGGNIFSENDSLDKEPVFRGVEGAINNQPVIVGVNLIEDPDPTFLAGQLAIELAGYGVPFDLKFDGEAYLLSLSNDDVGREVLNKYATLPKEEQGQARILLRIIQAQP